ncbi:hypothetical protein CC80DRAFT_589618 [Byssothecium circinans]|uniref:Uncharacterized protein n=1 Tax=Byssothecium circinans TaxID=147558 RepID=A0A6A5UE75_9PLEO|nr:hypothetical protein CC80DRAFT_589618 [Byssothecium circinans]
MTTGKDGENNWTTMSNSASVAAAPATNNQNIPVPEGYVELSILTKLCQVLEDSEDPDDHKHGRWIKWQYLGGYDGGEKLRVVRDIEGYQKIDNAYKRVRTLTGKAQHEWPFMTVAFQKLPATKFRSLYHLYAPQTSAAPSAPKSVDQKSASSDSQDAEHGAFNAKEGALSQNSCKTPTGTIENANNGTHASPTQPRNTDSRVESPFVEPEPQRTNLDARPPTRGIKRKGSRKRTTRGAFTKSVEPPAKRTRVTRGAGRAAASEDTVKPPLPSKGKAVGSNEQENVSQELQVEGDYDSNGRDVKTPEAKTAVAAGERRSKRVIKRPSSRITRRSSASTIEAQGTRDATEETEDVFMDDASVAVMTEASATTDQAPSPDSGLGDGAAHTLTKPTGNPEDISTSDVEVAAQRFLNGGRRTAQFAESTTPPTQPLSTTPSRTPTKTPSPAPSMESAPQLTIMATPSSELSVSSQSLANANLVDGTVEFFARVHGSTGTLHIPIPEAILTDGDKLTSRMKKYAEYKHNRGDDAAPFARWIELVEELGM